MQDSYHKQDLPLEGRRPADLVALLAAFGEEVAAQPENLEGALRKLVSGVRVLFGLRAVELSATVGESRRVFAAGGWSGVVGSVDASVAEVPILRGKTPVGLLRAYPPASRGRFGDAEQGRNLPEPIHGKQREGLRTVAAVAALALDAAHARELATQRAAHSSAVQIASEALGTILDEKELYRTVLVLTLELLGAFGGAILLESGTAVSLGLEDSQETLAALERVRLRRRDPWMGRIGGYHALGVGFGQEGGAVFLVRQTRPYSEAEGVSLKLVARQLARARERSRLYASRERTTLEAISALAATLESRDDVTGEHIKRTQDLAGDVAQKLGLDVEEARVVRYAAVLHDIGKIGIPDAVLNKPGKLTEEEWKVMRRHPKIGADIVGRISGFERVAESVLAHHERHDGRGYPAGLAGREIPVGARLISAVDAYDAMISDRPYRRGMSSERAIAELEAGAGSQFDPEVVEALKAALLEGKEKSEERKETKP